jgi:hypothetical protein
VDPWGLEKIIFNMGVSPENASIHKKDLSGYKLIEVKSKSEIWNYMLYQDSKNTGNIAKRIGDPISDIVFLGHGDDEALKMRGNFNLFTTDWESFKHDYGDNLPVGTKVKGYTQSVITNLEGTDWGILDPRDSKGNSSILNKNIINLLFSRTVTHINCVGPDPSTPNMAK